jgi:hypothetical protein
VTKIFQVTYREKTRVITGSKDFFLGMQGSPEYSRAVSLMRIVVRRDDISTRIAVRRKAGDSLGGQRGPGNRRFPLDPRRRAISEVVLLLSACAPSATTR